MASGLWLFLERSVRYRTDHRRSRAYPWNQPVHLRCCPRDVTCEAFPETRTAGHEQRLVQGKVDSRIATKEFML